MLQNERYTFVQGPTLDVVAATDVGFVLATLPGPTTAKYALEQLRMEVDAAVTADPTNFSIWTVKNETTSTVIAVRTYAAGSSTALASEDLNLAAVTTSVTTIPPAGLSLSGGDIISWVKTHGGTGVACRPRCRMVVRRIQS